MNQPPTEIPGSGKEPYEPPSLEVVVLSSSEALLGFCSIIMDPGAPGGCQEPFSTS